MDPRSGCQESLAELTLRHDLHLGCAQTREGQPWGADPGLLRLWLGLCRLRPLAFAENSQLENSTWL